MSVLPGQCPLPLTHPTEQCLHTQSHTTHTVILTIHTQSLLQHTCISCNHTYTATHVPITHHTQPSHTKPSHTKNHIHGHTTTHHTHTQLYAHTTQSHRHTLPPLPHCPPICAYVSRCSLSRTDSFRVPTDTDGK